MTSGMSNEFVIIVIMLYILYFTMNWSLLVQVCIVEACKTLYTLDSRIT